MPPFNDIYIVTSERNEVCIGKFLSKYADLTADKIRNDFEVYNNDEWVKTGTLAATVAYGLMDNQRSFAMYFDSVVSSLKSVILELL